MECHIKHTSTPSLTFFFCLFFFLTFTATRHVATLRKTTGVHIETHDKKKKKEHNTTELEFISFVYTCFFSFLLQLEKKTHTHTHTYTQRNNNKKHND